MRKMTEKYQELQATELGDQWVVMTNWWSHNSIDLELGERMDSERV